MNKQEILDKLKAYQIKKKFAPDVLTGYTGLANRDIYTELNQVINSDLIPLFSFLVKENRLTDNEVSGVLHDFFQYQRNRKITSQLDTEDREELTNIILNLLRILQMEHIPIEIP